VSFAARAWRILVAIKDGLALLFLLIFFWLLYLVLTASPNAAKVREGALLLKMDGVVVEQPVEVSPRDALTGSLPDQRQMRLRDIVHGLETAAKDSDVKALVVDLSNFSGGGQSSLMRIGEAIAGVRKAGKPVFAFANGYFDDAYLLAANASEIWIDPMGQTVLQGPGGSRPYLKGLADRLGVNVHVYKVGTYKSAVEPFIRDGASPEARTANQALVDALWADWQDKVQRARPKAQLKAILADPMMGVDANGGDLAKAAVASGMVDKIGDGTAFGKHVAALVGREDDDRADAFNATTFDDYVAANPEPTKGDKIGIVTVAGEIVDGHAPLGMAGGDTISDLVLDALAKKELKALVVRIDSPGGSAFASEKIRRAFLEAKAQKLPVVISMGDVAASGGYWVAMTGDRVFAEPSTITGSIGVFAIFPTFEKTAAQYGVTSDGVSTTSLSGQPNVLSGTNATVDRFFQTGVEDIYRRFTTMVAGARRLDVKRVDAIGQGRVWDGGTARQIGLVDAFGSLDDAVAEAAKLAKIDPNRVERVYLESERSFFGNILTGLFGGAQAKAAPDLYTRLAQQNRAFAATGLYDAARILHGPAVQVRCLGCPTTLPKAEGRSFFALLNEKVFP
jgi:protease IV